MKKLLMALSVALTMSATAQVTVQKLPFIIQGKTYIKTQWLSGAKTPTVVLNFDETNLPVSKPQAAALAGKANTTDLAKKADASALTSKVSVSDFEAYKKTVSNVDLQTQIDALKSQIAIMQKQFTASDLRQSIFTQRMYYYDSMIPSFKTQLDTLPVIHILAGHGTKENPL